VGDRRRPQPRELVLRRISELEAHARPGGGRQRLTLSHRHLTARTATTRADNLVLTTRFCRSSRLDGLRHRSASQQTPLRTWNYPAMIGEF
jgi:hypothetical protein